MTSKAQGKRQSRSQKIGAIGEAVFQAWALRNGLLPQKVDHDFGVDFYSQVMSPISRTMDETTGAVLAVQVKSAQDDTKKRVSLTRSDVVSALRVQTPYCLIAVDVAESVVRFRFLNEDLIERFSTFLEGSAQRLLLRIDEFGAEEQEFRRQLADASRGGRQQRLRVKKAQLSVRSAIPGARLTVSHGSDSDAAFIEVPWLTQLFDLENADRDALSRLVFESGSLPEPGQFGARLHNALEAIHELVDGPIIAAGALGARQTVTARCDADSASLIFTRRELADETAWTHDESGLVIVISACRSGPQGHYHHLSTRFAPPAGGARLQNAPFFRLLRPGATIAFSGGGAGIEVSSWPKLEKIGPALAALELAANRLGIDTADVSLLDLADEEFGKTLTLVDYLIAGVEARAFIPAVLVGPGASGRIQKRLWRPANFRTPILANLKGAGIVFWIEGIGDVYIREREICGFRMQRQTRWDFDVRAERFDKGVNPEVVVVKDWPAIQLFAEDQPTGWQGGLEHAIAGEFWPLTDSA
jgi:hypothetical protein